MARRAISAAALLGVLGVLAAGLGPGLAAPAAAQSLTGERVESIPVWPGVQRARWSLTNVEGDPVRAQVTRIAPDAPVDLRLAFGQGTLPGLETVPSMARDRVDDGAVLGINGGFWRSFPWGRPDGFTVRDGRLVVQGETRGDPDYGRGAVGLAPDGSVLMDRILPQEVTLQGGGQGETTATGLNRLDRQGTASVPPDGDDGLYLITDQLAATVTLPVEPDDPDGSGSDGSGSDGSQQDEPRGPARWRRVEGLTAVPSGPGQAGVLGTSGGAEPGETVSIPASPGALLVGYGESRDLVDALTQGEGLTASTTLGIHRPTPGRTASRWANVRLAVTGGPHIVRDGAMTGPSDWAGEGFGPAHHSRHPRTAVGVTGDGTVLLITVDGREDARSVGMGTAELASFFVELGAREAVMLDGGGSTTLTQGSVVVNRPSEGSPSPVANAVFVQHRETFTATERLAGPGREHTAAAVARAGFGDGASQAVLAASTNFPDALAGGPLAATLDAPMLLANPRGVSGVTMEALNDLDVERVTLLGGEAAVPAEAVRQLSNAGYDVERVAGDTRFSTAAEIAERVGTGGARPPERVALASGLDFADALVTAAPAGMMHIPTLLTAPDQLPGSTRQALSALNPDEVVVVGGTAAVSADVAARAGNAAGAPVTRLSGPTRFATARAINDWARDELGGSGLLDGGELDTQGLITARGDRFPDALAGGPLAAQRRQLLMIVPPWDVRASGHAAAYLDRREQQGLQRVSLLGGYAALTQYQRWQLEQLTR